MGITLYPIFAKMMTKAKKKLSFVMANRAVPIKKIKDAQ